MSLGGTSLLPVGGSSTNTDRKFELAGFGDLSKIFDFGSYQGKNAVKEGLGAQTDALNFFQTLLKGDRGQIANLLGPAFSNIQNQTQSARNTNSEFGNRSGGTNASTQNAEEDAQKQIQALISSIFPSAAGQVASIGGQIEGEGQNLINTAASAADSLTGHAETARQTDIQQSNALGASIGDIFAKLAQNPALIGLAAA